MSKRSHQAELRVSRLRSDPWCIVVADSHGPEWAPAVGATRRPMAVQYCGLGEPITLLQKAIHRAMRVAPASHVMVTAIDEYRKQWQPALWCVRPEHRFVGDSRSSSSLTVAAALLSIAEESASHVVTIIPATCFVVNERVLTAALYHARETLPLTPQGVMTLGMVDIFDGIDEDYLVPTKARDGLHWVVRAIARRPVPWVARHLRENGAMIASGILVGYAGVFATDIAKQCPGLALKLTQAIARSGAEGVECRVTSELQRDVPQSILRSLRWCAPAFPQRVLRVKYSGWSGLLSARAVARFSAIACTTMSARNRQESTPFRSCEDVNAGQNNEPKAVGRETSEY